MLGRIDFVAVSVAFAIISVPLPPPPKSVALRFRTTGHLALFGSNRNVGDDLERTTATLHSPRARSTLALFHRSIAGQTMILGPMLGRATTCMGLVILSIVIGTTVAKAERTDDFDALKLDADWVILSACNTAAGGSESAEALSGLARAFFYAGARSLLVSHWEVSSDTTVKLITNAVAELKSEPKIGRAEALRRSMLSMIANGKSNEAHPGFWAPFVLVGEGRAAR